MPRVLALLMVAAISISLTTVSAPRVAHAADQLIWYSTDRDLVEGETISGNKRVILQTNFQYSGRFVKKWCMYLDGQALTGRSYEADYDAPSPAASNPVWIYYENGVVSRGAGDQTTPGCWTTVLADRASGIDITLNTTPWSNGSHVVRIDAIIDDTTTISKSTTITSSNTDPTVEWLTSAPLNATSTMTLSATITPRVNRIAQACLTRDGIAIQRTEQTSFLGDTRYDGMWGGPTGTFGSTTGGCVLFDKSQDSGWPNGLRQVTTLTISLKTSTWTQIPAALALTVTDSIGREFSSSIAFNPAPPTTTTPSTVPNSPGANNDNTMTHTTVADQNNTTSQVTTTTTKPSAAISNLPTLSATGVSEGQTLSGWANIQASMTGWNSGASWTLCVTGISSVQTCGSDIHVVNTACVNDGNQQVTLTASDRSGYVGSPSGNVTKVYNVALANPAPRLVSAKASQKKPSWKSSTTAGAVALRSTHGCSYVVSLKSATAKAKTYKGNLDSDSTSISFSGLKPKTKYTGKASVVSPKGTKTKTFTFTTPAIPARPRSTGGGSGSGGGGSYVRNLIGLQLDYALMLGGSSFYYRQYSSCFLLRGNYENGFLGVLDESNWVVVDQSGYTLYVCKRK